MGILADAFAGEARSIVTAKLHSLLSSPGEPSVPPLTPAQFAQLRSVALDAAGRLGLTSDTATLQSDAIIGGLVPAPAAARMKPTDGRQSAS